MNRTNALAVGDAGRMGFTDVRTYMYAVIFLLGNIMLPQLCHLVPGAGATWLPIYFFTLVGAYLMGWRVGLLTAVASPLVNSVVFGMPAPELLPVIMMKSSLLAISASVAAHLFRNVVGGCGIPGFRNGRGVAYGCIMVCCIPGFQDRDARYACPDCGRLPAYKVFFEKRNIGVTFHGCVINGFVSLKAL